jgi:UDP-N-acetylglucosamine 1-carboxyvinyltransferase
LSQQQLERLTSAPAEPRIVLEGGRRLEGVIRVSGSKNASLAILAGTLLASEGVTTLRNLPRISDIRTMALILQSLGVRISFSEQDTTATFDATHLTATEAPADLVARMRASFFVLGPVLARLGRARVAQPGGCNIGARAIDLHIKGLKGLGAIIDDSHGSVSAEAGPGGIVGSRLYLDLPSVGATLNTMMAAALANGVTVIENAAQEPDVEDLGNLLVAMGARVHGHGTGTLTIEGVKTLRGCEYSVMPDRIEAGTLALAGGITGGDIFLRGANAIHLRPVSAKMEEVGMTIEEHADGVRVKGVPHGQRLRATKLIASPHPGFPTDLQQPFTSLLCIADGTSIVTDKVYESRFRFLTELVKMGAHAEGEGRTAVITGVSRLTGADVEATDLRAGAAMVVAGLAAEGRTRIFKTEHLERGYELLPEKLRSVGAMVWREDEFGRASEVQAERLTTCSHA